MTVPATEEAERTRREMAFALGANSTLGLLLHADQANRAQQGRGDSQAQARQIWQNLEEAIKPVRGGLQNIVKTTTYVTNIEFAAAVREVRTELYQASDPPSSTLLVVSRLADPDYMIEIEAIAAVD